VFALAMALSLAIIAVAGVFLAVRTNFDPHRTRAADLRLRNRDHRRPRQHVGHARRRHRPGRVAGDQRADRSGTQCSPAISPFSDSGGAA
jgi:hypothetical protein